MTTYISAELRRLVAERAEGRCEYCLIPEADTYTVHEIDHVFAEKHGGETSEENLCLSCWICNRLKGTDLCSLDLLTGQITSLFHPRRDQWTDHFRLDGATIVPVSPQGRVTVRLLQLNRQPRINERQLLIDLGDYPSFQR
ncbi:MAG: HNH endonuclease [Anaerolineae bacterium]|nr:HNH endonuclease [Anaerolineae bacterium]